MQLRTDFPKYCLVIMRHSLLRISRVADHVVIHLEQENANL